VLARAPQRKNAGVSGGRDGDEPWCSVLLRRLGGPGEDCWIGGLSSPLFIHVLAARLCQNFLFSPGMIAHKCNPTTGKLREEDREFKPAWATQRDPVSKQNK
jgi:hypothetical protein